MATGFGKAQARGKRRGTRSISVFNPPFTLKGRKARVTPGGRS